MAHLPTVKLVACDDLKCSDFDSVVLILESLEDGCHFPKFICESLHNAARVNEFVLFVR